MIGPFTSCDMKWKQLPSNTATRLSSKSSASHEAAALRPMVLKTSTSHRDKISSTPDRTIETYLPTNGSTHSKVSVIPSSEKKRKEKFKKKKKYIYFTNAFDHFKT